MPIGAICGAIVSQLTGKVALQISHASFNHTSWPVLPANCAYAIVSFSRQDDMRGSTACEVKRPAGWRSMTIEEAVLTREQKGRCIECHEPVRCLHARLGYRTPKTSASIRPRSLGSGLRRTPIWYQILTTRRCFAQISYRMMIWDPTQPCSWREQRYGPEFPVGCG